MTCKDCYKRKYCIESSRDYPCKDFVRTKRGDRECVKSLKQQRQLKQLDVQGIK